MNRFPPIFTYLDKQYTTYDEISEALLNSDVTGALIDTYVLGSRKNLFEKPSLRVMKIYDYSTTYGVVLGGESKKLSKCVGRYMQSHRMEIFQAIENHVDSVEVRKMENRNAKCTCVSCGCLICIQGLLLINRSTRLKSITSYCCGCRCC